MDIKVAQADMRSAYIQGGTGVLVSGLVWLTAAITGLYSTPVASMLVLFFGGMVIFPLSALLAKMMNGLGKAAPNNPLNKLAIESTFIIFVGLFIAFYIATLQVELFFPIMLLTIGVRYLTFNTLYGLKIYWLLGALLLLTGFLSFYFSTSLFLPAFVGGAIEVCFGFLLMNPKMKLSPEK